MPPKEAADEKPPATDASKDGADQAEGEDLSYSHAGTWLVPELGAGMNVHGRVPGTDAASSSDDPADVVLDASLWLAFEGRFALGFGYGRLGYGKERYAVAADASTLNVAYDIDALWVLGRYYFSAERPAVYAGLGLGLGIAQAKATGAVNDDPLVSPGVPFECSDTGGLGPGAGLAVGAEVDLSGALSFLSEAQASAHLMDDADDAHGHCGQGRGAPIPGAGPSIQGALRIALAYRLEL